MVAQIFVVVVCLLLLKYTLELAARTTLRRRTPAVARGHLRSRVEGLPRRWGVVLSVGLIIALIGAVSDRPYAFPALLGGVALTQLGVFLAGMRWARRSRRPARRERRAFAGSAVAPAAAPARAPRATLAP